MNMYIYIYGQHHLPLSTFTLLFLLSHPTITIRKCEPPACLISHRRSSIGLLSSMTPRDLTVCIRVNKGYYNCFVGHIWHTVELLSNQERTERFQTNYDPLKVVTPSSSHLSKTITASLTRNVSRIQVLKVEQARVLNLFFQPLPPKSKERQNDAPPPQELLNLKEIVVGLQNDPQPPASTTIDWTPPTNLALSYQASASDPRTIPPY